MIGGVDRVVRTKSDGDCYHVSAAVVPNYPDHELLYPRQQQEGLGEEKQHGVLPSMSQHGP